MLKFNVMNRLCTNV